jgi:tetratricopeptide (TPR) repeat protein
MRFLAAVLGFCLVPGLAAAVGSLDDTPPQPTATTTECTDGQVWDSAAGACVSPQESRLDDDTLYRAVREFAYTGAYGHAGAALAAMADQQGDRVLTYRGFIARKTGAVDEGIALYEAAITANPDNLLARSYLGQALVELGQTEAARAQLGEIRARGGRQTWPEIALRNALRSGVGYSY